MRTLTPQQAAARLGMTDHAIRDMVRAGRLGNLVAAGLRPMAIPFDQVSRVMLERRTEALRAVGDEAAFAVQINRQIWPTTSAAARADGRADVDAVVELLSVPRGRQAVPLLPENARKLWGPDVVTAAATKIPVGSCKTCFARTLARGHESMAPRDSPAYRALLGNPCSECTAAFAAEKRKAERRMRELQQNERQFRDQRQLEQFDAQQRQAMADVKRASTEFARLVQFRKQAGLPPLGGKR